MYLSNHRLLVLSLICIFVSAAIGFPETNDSSTNTEYNVKPNNPAAVPIQSGINQPPTTTSKSDSSSRSLFISSLMIICSEIGDKTFLIAAIMAMKHSRLLIFSASLSALVVMSILSAFLGCTLPNIMSKQYTEILAALLFLVFGVKMIKEGYEMSSDHVTEEMEEVSQELKEKGLEGDKKYDSLEEGLAKKDSDIDLQNDQENDGRGAEKKTQEWVAGFQNLLHYVVSPVFVQTFILTFLAEWGDRSQLATIALAAAGNMYMVIIGTVVGHSLCTGLAVVGGRLLATKISVRTVTICGGVLFVIFGLLTLYYKE